MYSQLCILSASISRKIYYVLNFTLLEIQIIYFFRSKTLNKFKERNSYQCIKVKFRKEAHRRQENFICIMSRRL